MRVRQRIDLLDKIARELQARYGYDDINVFLSSFSLDPPTDYNGPNSKWSYSKYALAGARDEILLKIADELEVSIPSMSSSLLAPPVEWPDATVFRLFISHLAKHKERAVRIKEELWSYKISCFVAHEDIAPTLGWQEQIERALFAMDAMLTIHTDGFSESVWTQQEIGVAIGRGVKIISLKLEREDPKGFIAKNQAILRRGRTADDIAGEIVSILTNDPLTKARYAQVNSQDRTSDPDEIPF